MIRDEDEGSLSPRRNQSMDIYTHSTMLRNMERRVTNFYGFSHRDTQIAILSGPMKEKGTRIQWTDSAGQGC